MWNVKVPQAACLALVGTLMFSLPGSAWSLGLDNASQAAYGDGWQNGDNGGSGFLPWFLNTSGTPGVNGNSTASFFTGAAYAPSMGTSFGVFANSPDGADSPLAEAIRSFSPAIGPGLSFSFQLSWNFRNGFKGFDLRAGGTPMIRFEASDNFGAGNEIQLRNLIASNSVSLFSGNYSSTALFDVKFTFLPANDIQVEIDYSGSAGNPHASILTGFSGLPDNFRFWVSDTGTGSNNNLYFNNLAVIPEPSSAALLMAFGLAGVGRRHRLKRSVQSPKFVCG